MANYPGWRTKKPKPRIKRSDPEKRTYDGIVFDSIAEMKHCRDSVMPRFHAKEITSLCYQVPFKFELKITSRSGTKVKIEHKTYIADFFFRENGKPVIEEVKGGWVKVGPDQARWNKVKRWMRYFYPEIELREIKV